MNQPILKTKAQIDRMRICGHILATIIRDVVAVVRPGIKTSEINEAAWNGMKRHRVEPSFLGYAPWGKTPYPAVICVSVDSEVVHGIPRDRKLVDGEIVSLDCGIHDGTERRAGLHADMAVTIPVGRISDEKRRLIDATRSALWSGIRAVRPGAMVSDVAQAIQAASKGYGVVAGYGGHGIGESLHEPPFVPNRTDQKFVDAMLTEGAVIAIEPMLNMGSANIREEKDGWTVVTADESASAHFEHTVAIVGGRFEVLTLID